MTENKPIPSGRPAEASEGRTCKTCGWLNRFVSKCAAVDPCQLPEMESWTPRGGPERAPAPAEGHGAALLEEIDGALFLCETSEQNDEERTGLRVHAEALIADWRFAADLAANERAAREKADLRADQAYRRMDDAINAHLFGQTDDRDAREKAEARIVELERRLDEISGDGWRAADGSDDAPVGCECAVPRPTSRAAPEDHGAALLNAIDEIGQRDIGDGDAAVRRLINEADGLAGAVVDERDQLIARVAEFERTIREEQECEVCVYPAMFRRAEAERDAALNQLEASRLHATQAEEALALATARAHYLAIEAGRAQSYRERVAELEARLEALARVHSGTLDRLHEVERQRDELEIRRARLAEVVGEGSHTAHHCRCGDVAKTR